MNSRRTILISAAVLVVAAIGYILYMHSAAPAAETTETPATATSTPGASIPLPAHSTTTPLGWKQFINTPQGYTISHPADLVRGVEPGGAASLTFPKNIYFHWPLLDDAKIIIAVGPTCPAITAAGLGGDPQPTTFELNGRTWKRTVGFDVGAGNRYEEIAYDLVQNSVCYHVGFLNHGTNGSGFYVDDVSLIAKYDAVHEADLKAVIKVLNGIISSFKLNGLKG